MSGTAFCTNCGARAEGTAFCTSCGNRMPVADPAPLTAPIAVTPRDPGPSAPQPWQPPPIPHAPATAPLFAADQSAPSRSSDGVAATVTVLVILLAALAGVFGVTIGLIRDGFGITDYRIAFSALSCLGLAAYLLNGLIGGLASRLPVAAAIGTWLIGSLVAALGGPLVVRTVVERDFVFSIWWWGALYATSAGLVALALGFALRGSSAGRASCAMLGLVLMVAAAGFSIFSIYEPERVDISANLLPHLVHGVFALGAALFGAGLGARGRLPHRR